MKFYLGTHVPAFVKRTNVPMMVSIRQTKKIKNLYPTLGSIFLDSGGFSELSLYGKWSISIDQYIEEIERVASIWTIDHIASMDYMCEPIMIKKTGLSVKEHQRRTVSNFLRIKQKTNLPIVPVIQGYTLNEYKECYKMYLASGYKLNDVVGLGSVCRRQATDEIYTIVKYFYEKGLKLHAFGVKIRGLAKYGHMLYSSDSLAWSFDARQKPPLSGHTHLNCANCLEYALLWRKKVIKNEN